MRHRLQWFIHLRAHDLRKGDEHPAYTPHGLGTVYLYLSLSPVWRPGAVVRVRDRVGV